MIEKRNIAICIILSIVTFGIYGLIWFVWLTDDTNKVSNDQQGTSGGIALLLTIVTCGIYGIYWAYRQGEKLDNAAMQRGLPKGDKAVLYLILELVGLGIVAWALMQDELNNMSAMPVTGYQQPYQQQYQQGYQQYQQPVSAASAAVSAASAAVSAASAAVSAASAALSGQSERQYAES